MSRTERKAPHNFFSHEGPWARAWTRRQERAKTKQLLRNGKHDLAGTRQVKGTQGWLTW